MSTYYLIDATTSPIANSEINNVTTTPGGTVVLGGNFVVRVPDGVSLGPDNPTDLTDLENKKYAGLLAFYAGYTRIAFDSLLDATGVNAATSTQVVLGERSTIRLLGYGGNLFESNPVVLSGGAPSQAVVTYETFLFENADPIVGRIQRTYEEVPPASVSTCQVSFNGGATWVTTTDGTLLNIAPADQGTSFIIRIASTVFADSVGLGSWAVIY